MAGSMLLSLIFCLIPGGLGRKSITAGVSPKQLSPESSTKKGLPVGAYVEIGCGVFLLMMLIVVVVIVVVCLKRKKKGPEKDEVKKEEEVPKERWRRLRTRRRSRRIEDKMASSKTFELEKKQNISIFANPNTLPAVNSIENKDRLAQYIQNRRIRRTGHRAEARGLARIRAHSRAHFRRLIDRKMTGNTKRQANKTVDSTRMKGKKDEQKRMRSKLDPDQWDNVKVESEYWREKTTRSSPPERSTKQRAPVEPKISQRGNFVPSSRQIQDYVENMAWYVDDRELDSSEGVAFRWPITDRVLLEKFPSNFTTYSYCEELGEMIQKWAEMGVFKMEYHIREQRPTTHWEYRLPSEEHTHMMAEEMRVKLDKTKWLRKTDWIDATYCGTAEDPQRFIMSPVPTEKWDYDYWSGVVSDHNVRCIVQLNNFDYRNNLTLDEIFVPFGRQQYTTTHETCNNPEEERQTVSDEKSKIVEYMEYRGLKKLRKKTGRVKVWKSMKRLLSAKRGKRLSAGKETPPTKDTEETRKEMEPRMTTTFAGKRRRDKESANRQMMRKRRRKQRREDRRVHEKERKREIFVKTISVRYLLATDKPTAARLFQNPNRRTLYRLAHSGESSSSSSFIVRVSLLRLVCRKEKINYQLVHFQVWTLVPFGQVDYNQYQNLVTTINKISGTVSVVSERCLARAPTFCLAALLMNQLKSNREPLDPVSKYVQMQIDRPYSMIRPCGFFQVLRLVLEYVVSFERRFPLKKDHKKDLEKFLREVKLALLLERY